jgi:DNA replication and repair protein RecF
MVILQKLALSYYKNYEVRRFNFEGAKLIGICGPNGTGKTNLLDAVYFCCLTKSYFASTELSNFHSGIQGFRIEGSFLNNGEPKEISIIYRETGKKEYQLNGIGVTKRASLIGQLPAVMIAPDDIQLINGSGETRRKFIDAILCQTDPEYLNQLVVYGKVLQQRNGLLKRAAELRNLDKDLLEILDEQLVFPSNYIYKARKQFFENFIPSVTDNYKKISGSNENQEIQYQSQLNEKDMAELLQLNLEKDRILQRTSAGIHKDDLIIEMESQTFRSIASQGQKKSMLFALKLAEFESLSAALHTTPVLLLDDVFEKLDHSRMNNLLSTICFHHQAQVIITDTHKERIEQMFENLGIKGSIIFLG